MCVCNPKTLRSHCVTRAHNVRAYYSAQNQPKIVSRIHATPGLSPYSCPPSSPPPIQSSVALLLKSVLTRPCVGIQQQPGGKGWTMDPEHEPEATMGTRVRNTPHCFFFIFLCSFLPRLLISRTTGQRGGIVHDAKAQGTYHWNREEICHGSSFVVLFVFLFLLIHL